MACKSTTVLITTRIEARLGLTAMSFFVLVLSLPGIILSLASDRVADPSRSKTVGAF